MFQSRKVLNWDRRALLSNRVSDRGATLAELLVVLVIISVLAVITIPVAETTAQREKEAALRETLRDVRTALDAFNADVRAEEISTSLASENGWPPTLELLGEAAMDGCADIYVTRPETLLPMLRVNSRISGAFWATPMHLMPMFGMVRTCMTFAHEQIR
jgi:prepilin-type N-terminal cleavage/methylation domain-containing protein